MHPVANQDASLPFGAYETPLTQRVAERLAITQQENPFAKGAVSEAGDNHRARFAEAITQTISEHLVQKLLRTDKLSERVALINALAELIDPDDAIEAEALLHAVYEDLSLIHI